MKLESLCTVWPHSYHVTAKANLASIRESRVLWPARTLLERANRSRFVRQRRTQDLILQVEMLQVLIRNQISLEPSLLDLGPTCTLEEYVACLNSYVFFWPGTTLGPISDGLRMFERTNGTPAVIIRVPTASLIGTNGASPKYVTTCNTGKTWTERGMRVRRDPQVFQCLNAFSGQPASIREICFKGEIRFPDDAELGTGPAGPWTKLL